MVSKVFRSLFILTIGITIMAAGALALGQEPSHDVLAIAAIQPGDTRSAIYLIDLNSGSVQRVTPDDVDATSPAWSPDGTKLAYEAHDNGGHSALYLRDFQFDYTRPLSNTPDDAYYPVWSPDGQYVAFVLCCDADDLAVQNVSTSEIRRFDVGISALERPAWLPDGSGVLVAAQQGMPDIRIALQPLTGDPLRFVGGDEDGMRPRPSPDGQRVAYVSQHDGVPNVLIAALSDNHVEPRGAGDMPLWSPDGERIAYVYDGNLYTMNSAHNDVRQVTDGSPVSGVLAWSPDGRQLVFVQHDGREDALYVVDSDGQNLRRITEGLNVHLPSGVSWWHDQP